MKNLFPFPGQILLALAVAFVALLALSTHQLVRAGTAAAFAGLVIACTGMLAVLIVAALGQVVDVLKPLLLARVGSTSTGSVGYPLPLTHRQNLEQGIANEVVRAALTPGISSHSAGEKARTALDALTGTAEPVPAKPSMPAGAIDIEGLIQANGKTAPRVTPDDLQANIVSEHYFTAGQGIAGRCYREVSTLHSPEQLELLTFCVLVLRNGFTVTGESACASPENFDAEIGRQIARANAVEKIWPLMGYELRTKLATTRYGSSL